MIDAKYAALFGYGGPNAYFPAVWFAEAMEGIELEWDTSQGVAPRLNFTPVRGVEVAPEGVGARCGSSPTEVEARAVVDATTTGVRARAWVARVSVDTTTVARALSVRASAGVGCVRVETPGLTAVVAPRPCRARAGVSVVTCVATKNPTDEELILLFLRKRHLTS